MVTHRKMNETNERGALMIEAIALLGLMTLMSPMVVRQTSDRTAEMQEVAVAGQMKELRDALNNWISANYQTQAASHQASDLNFIIPVSASDLAPYLSAASLDGAAFRGNKLVDGFDVGVRAECTEMRRQDGTAPQGVTLANGIVTAPAPTAAQFCSRYRMSGIVLSNGGEIDDRRASRIATMIGADGGYTRTQSMVDAFPDEDDAAKKVLGSQGIWEGNTDNYFNNLANTTGRIAVTTSYSSGFSGDFLYRKQVAGLPDANSMFTDLDMGGNTECNNGNCHNITNAGGLEVVNGQIVIRSQNNAFNAADQMAIGNPGDADYARIALGTQSSHMRVTNDLNFTANNGTTALTMNNQGATLSAGNENSSLEMRNNIATLKTAGGAQLEMNTANATLSAGGGATTLDMDAAGATLSNGTGSLEIENNSAVLSAATTEVNLTNATVTMKAGNAQSTLTQNEAKTRVGDDTLRMKLENTAGQKMVVMQAGNAQISASNSADDTARSARFQVDNMVTKTFNENNVQGSIFRSKGAGRDAISGLFRKDGQTQVTTRIYTGDIPSDTLDQRHLELAAQTLDTNGDSGRFSLHLKNAAGDGDSAKRFVFNATDGLKMYTKAGVDSEAAIDENATPATIAMDPDRGRISAGFFQPQQKVLTAQATWGNIVKRRVRLGVDDDTGATNEATNQDTSAVDSGQDASVTVDASVYGDQAPYTFHQEWDEKYYKNFRVDPAYISVMNDIKLTSRGGARLSEALSNYILKGIYVLSNSFSAGDWPCTKDGNTTTGNTCSFRMPYYDYDQLGLVGGGYEFNCPNDHPLKAGGGYCKEESNKYVVFDYSGHNSESDLIGTDKYFECDDDETCWAHPFMGRIPAPGRSVSTVISNKETRYLHGADENICPDGYQAVLTVTPNSFEMGKLLMLNPNALNAGSAIVRYNFGYLDFGNDTNRDITHIIQAGTRLGIATRPEVDPTTNQIKGWSVAMGTVTPTGGSGENDYIWNFGGIPTNSWTAVAHTYCYFNPERFTMPNMRFEKESDAYGGQSFLTTEDNPLLENQPSYFNE